MNIVTSKYIPYTFSITGRIVSFDRFIFNCAIDQYPDLGYENCRVCIWLEEIVATVDSTNCTATKIVMTADDFIKLSRDCEMKPDVLLRKYINNIAHTPRMCKKSRDILYGYIQANRGKVRCWREILLDPVELLLLKAKAEEYYGQNKLAKKA